MLLNILEFTRDPATVQNHVCIHMAIPLFMMEAAIAYIHAYGLVNSPRFMISAAMASTHVRSYTETRHLYIATAVTVLSHVHECMVKQAFSAAVATVRKLANIFEDKALS